MRTVRAGSTLPAKAETPHAHFTTVVTALILISALLLLAGRSPRAETMRLRDVESGSLLLRGANAEPGAFVAAPMVKTHVRMDVSGPDGETAFAEKDFILELLPEAERGRATALFAEALENGTYRRAVQARERQTVLPRPPRTANDVTDILD